MDELEEQIDPTHLHAVTVGQHGFWAVELTWTDADGEAEIGFQSARAAGMDNVGSDLQAALYAIQEADRRSTSVEIHSVNDSNVRTMAEYMPDWKRRGWLTSQRKSPANVETWKEIDGLSQRVAISWKKRSPSDLDGFKEYERLKELGEERLNEHLMQRALQKDLVP